MLNFNASIRARHEFAHFTAEPRTLSRSHDFTQLGTRNKGDGEQKWSRRPGCIGAVRPGGSFRCQENVRNSTKAASTAFPRTFTMNDLLDSSATSTWQKALDRMLADFVPAPESTLPVEVQQAVHLVRKMQVRAAQLQTPQERRQQAELDRMIHSPQDKATLMQLTDQAFRSSTPHRAIDQLIHILDVQGIPRFFTPVDRALLKGFQSFGSYLPGVAAPLVKEKMHKETANVVLPAEADMLTPHLEHRRQQGIRMNVNYLGESLLGEEEARERLNGYLQALQLAEIEVISGRQYPCRHESNRVAAPLIEPSQ